MAYIRPRQENIFDNFGLNPEYDYGFDSYSGTSGMSPGMSPSDLPEVESPFGQPRNRLPDIFGQPKEPSPVDFGQGGFNPDISVPSQPTPQVPGSSEIDIFKQWSDKYTPETQANERLNRLLEQAPQTRGPGLGRGLIAASMALGNRPTAEIEAFKQAPYLREMADWKAKAEPYEKAAGLENQRNIQERTLVGQMLQYQTQAEKNRATEEYNTERNRIAEIRALAQKAKAEGYKVHILGNRVVGINPAGKQIELGSSGKLNEQDRIILEGEWDVKAAEARGNAAIDALTVRGRQGGETYQLPDGRVIKILPNQEVEEVQPPGTGKLTKPGTTRASDTKDSTAKEYNDQEQIKMRKLISTYPWAEKFFKPGSGNTIVLKPRNSVADKESWDKVNKELNPSYVPPPAVEDKGVLGPSLDWLKNKFGKGTSTAPYDPSGGTPGPNYGSKPAPPTEATPPAPTPAPKQAPMKPTGNVMGGAPTPDIPEGQRVPAGALRQKAIGALLERKEQITESNIRYVVDKGLVK